MAAIVSKTRIVNDQLDSPNSLMKYHDQVRKGHDRMLRSSVVVGAIGRDVAKFIPGFAQRLSDLVSLFEKHQVVIYENDSVDRTVEYLRILEDRFPNLSVISERLGTAKFGSTGRDSRSTKRMDNMAAARNRVLDEVRRYYSKFDYYCVVDLDLHDWDLDGIATTFYYEDWDMVGSQGLIKLGSRYRHYDTWAFRKLDHPEPHPDREIANMILRRGSPLMRVSSCFGGLGFYRMSSVLPYQYSGPECEHVGLHKAMAAGGHDRIYLNPSMICEHRR
jgi:hypothetical protein